MSINTKFNVQFITNNFQLCKDVIDNGNHPESTYDEFYCECLESEIDSLLTPEDKTEWVKEWQDSLELEGEDAELEFHELLEQFDSLTEDVSCWLIETNPSVKEKFIPFLYEEMKNDESFVDYVLNEASK